MNIRNAAICSLRPPRLEAVMVVGLLDSTVCVFDVLDLHATLLQVLLTGFDLTLQNFGSGSRWNCEGKIASV